MPKNIPEWRKFRVGKVSKNPRWVNPDCQPLRSIYHVTHIPVALEILRSGYLMPRLVYDKSKLNKRRITVTWLSPNVWNDGSRYGNVEFCFDWKRLAEGVGKRFYWVESIPYKVEACRILITKQDHSNDPDLVEFDPTVDDGPWWWDKATDTHWWNGNYCLEIMAEGRLAISKCERVEFVAHHPHGCCIDHSTCLYKGFSKERGIALFLATTISQEIDLSPLKLVPAEKKALTRFDTAYQGWFAIWQGIKDLKCTGEITSNMKSAIPLVRAVLGAYSRGNGHEIKSLASMFCSNTELRKSYEKLFETVFNIPSPDVTDDSVAF
ncbi:MAG: hypothetical protein NTY01_01445 [Verrucomicrobia bacterium]|nr:hypothetical protein [Verrucomicrobiota bacterium]